MSEIPTANGKLATAVMGSTPTNTVRMLRATFVAAEAVDADLSKILLTGGEPARWVPKGKHVGVMTPGDSLLLISDGNQYAILMVLVGDISLADAGM